MPSDDSWWLGQVRTTWNQRAGPWDEMSAENATCTDRQADLERLAAALKLQPGSRLLDAGCGSGQFAVAIAQRGCAVTAVDIASEMIERARANAAKAGVDVEFRTGDMSSLSGPGAVYDAIHARVVMHLAPDVSAVMREFRRVLKPGGRLFVSVPGALSPIYGRSWRRHFEPREFAVNMMVPWELENLLAHFGWTVVDQWGDLSRSLSGRENALKSIDLRTLDLRLQQAIATTWAFVAE